jgi:hypothetical protein
MLSWSAIDTFAMMGANKVPGKNPQTPHCICNDFLLAVPRRVTASKTVARCGEGEIDSWPSELSSKTWCPPSVPKPELASNTNTSNASAAESDTFRPPMISQAMSYDDGLSMDKASPGDLSLSGCDSSPMTTSTNELS